MFRLSKRLTSKACQCPSSSTSLPCRHVPRSSYSHKTSPNSAPSPSTSATTTTSNSIPPQYTWFEPVQHNRRSSGWKDWGLFDSPPSAHSIPSPAPPAPSASDSDPTSILLNDYITQRGPRTSLNQFEDEYGQLLEIANEKDLPFLKAMVLEDLQLKELSNRERNGLGMDRFGPKKGTEGTREVKNLSEMVEKIEGSEGMLEEDRRIRKKKELRTSKAEEEPVTTSDSQTEGTISTRTQALSVLQQISRPSSPQSSFSIDQLSQTWDLFVESADLEDSLHDYSLTLSFLHYLVSTQSSSSSDSDVRLQLALKAFGDLVQVLPEELIASQPSISPSDPTTLASDISLRYVILRTIVNSAISEDLWEISARSLLSLSRLDLDLSQLPSLEELIIQTSKGWMFELRNERISSYKPSKLASSASSLDQLVSLFTLLPSHFDDDLSIESTRRKELLNELIEECAERYRWDLIAKLFQAEGKEGFELAKYHLKFARWLTGEAPYSTYPSSRSSPTSDSPSRSTRLVQPELFSLFARKTHHQLRRTLHNLSDSWTLDEKFEWLDLLTSSKGATRETRSLARRIALYWTSRRYPLNLGVGGGKGKGPFLLRSSTLLNLVRTSLPPYSSSPTYSATAATPATTADTATATSPTEHFALLRKLINSSIQALVSPHSPYSSVTPSSSSSGPYINHFDLTALAQSYALLNDFSSFAQVYRKLVVESRFLPDKKDVDLILSQAVRIRGGGVTEGLEFVRESRRVGVKVGEGVVRGLVRSVWEREMERRRELKAAEGKEQGPRKRREKEDQRWKLEIEEIMKFAKEELTELRSKDLRQLEDYVVGSPPLELLDLERIGKLSDTRLISMLSSKSNDLDNTRRVEDEGISTRRVAGLLKKCQEMRNHALATRIYLLILDETSPSSISPLLTLTLQTLLQSHASASSSTTKARILDQFKLVIDSTLSSPSPPLIFRPSSSSTSSTSSTKKEDDNIDLAVKGLIKVGESQAIDEFFAQVLVDNTDVKNSIKEMVVRWSVGKEGRDAVRSREEGVVGEWAREILKKQNAE
ncbi:uncharacterized protein JCM6883_005587 [Sporobolomyces salmoneus]|uniref:uncharacterized protein n=1 Tax=Sporobolomyces salmoneus TaxID=183962 RepID=UPI003172BF0E